MRKFSFALRLRLVLVCGLSLLGGVGAGMAGQTRGDSCVTLAVFSLNDFHGSFISDSSKDIPGVAAICHTLDSLKAVYPYNVTVAAGDNFGGSYFSTVTGASLIPTFFDEAGITVSAVGNHEFDNGVAFLSRKWADVPTRPAGWNLTYVCANATDSSGHTPAYMQPAATVSVPIASGDTVRVAFVGLIASSTPEQVRAANVKGLTFNGHYDDVLNRLKATPTFNEVRDADVRLLLMHIGTRMSGGVPVWDDKDSARLLAIRDTLYHGILSAHSHQPVCGTINDGLYPIVQGWWHGNYISMLKVRLDLRTRRVASVEPSLVPVPLTISPTSPVARRWQERIDSLLAVTRLDGGYPLSRQIAVSDCEFVHDRNNQYGFTQLGTLVCASYAVACREAVGATADDVVIGVCHFGTVRAPLPAGRVTVMDVGEALPFANRIRVYRMTGEEIRRLAEVGLNNTRYGWMQSSGLEVVADTTAGKVSVRSLRYVGPQGKRVALSPKKTYLVAADEFMTTGGDGYAVGLFPDKREVKCDVPTTTHAFIRYIERLGRLHSEPSRTRKIVSD